MEVPTLGSHLATDLGDDLLVIALTTAGGRVLTRRRSATSPEGVELVEVDLDAPAEGSIEALLAADAPVLTDVRALSADRTRVLDTYQDLPVARSFDLVACLPTITPTTR